MTLSLFGALTVAGVYCGFSAAHAFGLIGVEVFAACTLCCGILYAAAEWTA